MELERIHSVAIEWLLLNPLAGELYDGELACSLDKSFIGAWPWSRSSADRLRTALGEAICSYDSDVVSEVQELLSRLNSAGET